MKFTVDLVNKSGRLGVLSKADFKMKTPAFVMTTKVKGHHLVLFTEILPVQIYGLPGRSSNRLLDL